MKYSLISFIVLALATIAFPQEAKKPRLDAVGDPLPAQALHRFGTSRFCTQAEVTSLVLSQDGKLLAAADRERRVYLWDTETGKERIPTGPGSGKRVAISPDSQWIAFGDEGGLLEVRNLRNDKTARPSLPPPRDFAFTSESKEILVATAFDDFDYDGLYLFDLTSGKKLRTFAGLEKGEIVKSLTITLDGKYIAAATMPPVELNQEKEKDKPFMRVILWNAGKKDKLKHIDIPGRVIRNLVFLPDNKTLIGQVGSRLVAWSIPSLDRIEKISHEVGSSYALDSTGKILATTDGPMVLEFDGGKELHDFEVPTQLRHVAMSGDGKLLAASAARFEDGSPRIMLWDLTKSKERSLAEAHRHYIDAVAFSHDGKTIATASHVEGAARVWDAKNAKPLQMLNIDSLVGKKSGGPRARRNLIDALAFSADRPELFVCGQRWDLRKAEPIALKGDVDFIFDQTNSMRAVLTPDAQVAASILHDQSILFWDPAKALPIQRVVPDRKKGDWHAFAFTPNGKLAASGRWFAPIRKDGGELLADTVNVWDVAAGKLVKSFRQSPSPIVRLMFSPDGETLAVIGFPNRLELWHLQTGRLLREMYLSELDETMREFVLPPVAFAPHGQWIAYTHREGEIVLIETITGKEILTLRGHHGHISSVAFSPDNRRLLSGGRDTTAILWSPLPENPPLPAAWKDTDKLWLDLGGPTTRAYPTVWALMKHPDRAIEVLTKRLQPDGGATDKEVNELITNLSSAKFAKRDIAIRRLKEIGVRSLPALEQAQKKAPDLETVRRIQELLKTVETSLTPEALRDQRALLILEMIDTPPARALLADIARGDGGAGKTRMARAALVRLKQSDGR